MRRLWLPLSLAVIAAAGIARAEVVAEAIPSDTIQTVAPFAVQAIQQQFPNPPVKVDPNTEKIFGYHVKQAVAMVVVPDRNLTAKAIEETADSDVPVAIVTTKSLSFREKDKETVVSGDKLAVADVNGVLKLPVFFLSIKRQGADRVLQIYSKDQKPVLSAPLKKEGEASDAPLTVKLTNIDLEKKTLDATFFLAGGYQSTFKLGFLEF
jgi:hypothetical protein